MINGKRIAVEVGGQVWIYDTTRDTLTRLTFDGGQNDGPTTLEKDYVDDF